MKYLEAVRDYFKTSGMPDGGRFFTQWACDIRKAAEPPTAIQSSDKAIGRGNPDGFQVQSTQSWRKKIPQDGVLAVLNQTLEFGR